jgi:hypothetical protein
MAPTPTPPPQAGEGVGGGAEDGWGLIAAVVLGRTTFR